MVNKFCLLSILSCIGGESIHCFGAVVGVYPVPDTVLIKKSNVSHRFNGKQLWFWQSYYSLVFVDVNRKLLAQVEARFCFEGARNCYFFCASQPGICPVVMVLKFL